MTLDEFQTYQHNKKKASVAPTQPKTVQKPTHRSEHHTSQHTKKAHRPSRQGEPPKKPLVTSAVATTTPVTDIFIDEAKAKIEPVRRETTTAPRTWKPDDVAPLLQEPVEKPRTVVSPTTSPGENLDETVDRVLRHVGWYVNGDVKRRLHSLIVSRIKDVRTDDQFLAYAATPTPRGGVGLGGDQAKTLLGAIHDIMPKNETAIPISETPKKEVLPPRQPASTQPPRPLPTLRDVVPPEPVARSVGPKEEFSTFSLLDFRRLAPTADASLSRIKEKFDQLKAESYILFLSARDAWNTSPLHRDYVSTLVSALQKRQKISTILPEKGGRETLTMDVFKAVVEINKHIAT